MIKPFLVLQLRPETEAADNELEAILTFGRLSLPEVHRIHLDREILPSIDLDSYSGVIVGGGPYNVSDAHKDDNQLRVESQLGELFNEITERDFPYLGMCYGFGFMVNHLGGEVSKEQYSETTSAVDIEITDEGKKDALLEGLPDNFRAFVGHKEACQKLSDKLVHLASSANCPYQMIRHKSNIYATQFHPELDAHGLEFRINVYMHAGYFDPADAQDLINMAHGETIKTPEVVLRRFIERYSIG